MLGFVKSVLRYLLIRVGRVLSFILFDLTVHGKENLPAPNQHPLIVIANHFSWFDAPLLAIHLPFYLAFVVATESLRNWWVRHFINLFDVIQIWRGQVDRNAIRLSLEGLMSTQLQVKRELVKSSLAPSRNEAQSDIHQEPSDTDFIA